MVGMNIDRHGRLFANIMKPPTKFQIMTTGFSPFGDFTMQVRDLRILNNVFVNRSDFLTPVIGSDVNQSFMSSFEAV